MESDRIIESEGHRQVTGTELGRDGLLRILGAESQIWRNEGLRSRGEVMQSEL